MPTTDSSSNLKSKNQVQDFSIAAANAITILNIIGYDFSKMDFQGVSIAGAELSKGRFEETNFTSANLQGVNFTNAWLKNATFEEADMNRVHFGVTPKLELDREAFCIAYSPDGNSLIIGALSEIIICDLKEEQSHFFTEVRRLKGHTGLIKSCSFSKNGKHMITGGEDGTICVWNSKTKKCSNVLRGHNSTVFDCKI